MKQDKDAVLKKNIKNLNNIIKWLLHSYTACKNLDPEDNSELIQDFFEAYTSRFGRAIDILSNKIFRTIDLLEMEIPGTTIDAINRAHKRGLIESVEQFRLYKDLRNSITHEYNELGLHKIFSLVQQYTPDILNILNKSLQYLKKFS